MVEQSTRTDGQDEMQRLSKALHDLCQPLTTLQCRLEMAGVIGTATAYREAVEHGLDECGRLIDAVDSMRGMVRAAAQRSESPQSLREGGFPKPL
ncbi:MAG TPA: hypothetical protein VII58_13640 [Acidobacteriaceae bacterium]